MSKVVTIGIPVYKRLDYLPNVLRIVAAQDYPHIDLLVSDNGMNGNNVQPIVDQYYSKPYRFRQNPATVSGSSHYNQLIQNASTEFVIILADDDEISPNFVSELIRVQEKYPEASAVVAREELIDLSGNVLRRSKDTVPEVLRGEEFIRTTFETHEYGYGSLCTFLAKTGTLKANGGFPEIWGASGDEDILMIKLALGSSIAFATRCAFRKRFHETSGGFAISPKDLARGIREFVKVLDSDPTILKYAAAHPAEWKKLRDYAAQNAWGTYYSRWKSMYCERLSTPKWIAAAFQLPRQQYGRAVNVMAGVALWATLGRVKRIAPPVYSFCQAIKVKLGRMISAG
jgi:glycosyltransferase involved in cell wall biosynthesis